MKVKWNHIIKDTALIKKEDIIISTQKNSVQKRIVNPKIYLNCFKYEKCRLKHNKVSQK